ncbi:MAG TPA: RluA family pseudouridine synthase [Candidatus Polarisedimenticolia bacterium]|nr:RluA family pseudouridine synthase [Candidatus Polarisedimenticolia bacterium]
MIEESGSNSGFVYREELGSAATGRFLAAYLGERYRHSSTELWEARAARGEILLDGAPAGPRAILRPGQILLWKRPPWREPAAPCAFAVLYRDAELLAVLKPSGLPTLPGGGYLENTLLRRVRRLHPEASPLHRLGRGTTGLVLFSRTREAARRLSEAWRRGEVRKVYRAVVDGEPKEDRFVVEAGIGRVPYPILGSVHAAERRGKASISRVTVLERRERTTLVEVEIVTGRPHQVRIHLAFAGHPLAGDPLYASGGLPKEDHAALPGNLGYLLHARLLRFRHPRTGASVAIRAHPPSSLRDANGR